MASSRKIRVLFVDDEPDVLAGLRDALRKERFEILTETSAPRALAQLAEHHPDIVVSDERMPEMCGSEFLAKVCQRYPDCVRILLTGHASVEGAIRAINEGAIYRFLTKPCAPKELASAIRDGMELKEMDTPGVGHRPKSLARQVVLKSLEANYPGITEIERDADGAIMLELPDTADELG